MSKRDASAAISRMPRAVRDEVGRCLQEGGTWRDVAEICEAHGYKGVNAQNVTNYRQGGYAEWLKIEERLREARDKYKIRTELLKAYAAEGGAVEAGLQTAMDTLEEALEGVDVSQIQALMMEKPQVFLQVVDRLIKLRGALAEIRVEKLQEDGESVEKKKGLNAEEMKEIERAAGIAL